MLKSVSGNLASKTAGFEIVVFKILKPLEKYLLVLKAGSSISIFLSCALLLYPNETAIKNNLPILIHVRDAFEETYKILSEYKSELKTVLVHCFTGNDNYAEKFLNLGCYFSITGIITFKNANKLRETIKKLPKNKIFFETDAPYLTPVPMRGEINKPSLLKHIIEYYCELTDEDFTDIANISSKNYERFISCQP